MLKQHDKELSEVINSETDEKTLKTFLKHHRRMVKIIQHERLIHLIVMVFVGLSMTMTCLAATLVANLLLIILSILLMVLFTAYIFHYRYLENTTQRWYVAGMKIENKISNKEDC